MTTDKYKLTPKQKELAMEVRDWYHGNIDEFIEDMNYKIDNQYERQAKSKKMTRKHSVQMIARIKENLPKIIELKNIDDDLKTIDPHASIIDLL